jgi:hypothetical protein
VSNRLAAWFEPPSSTAGKRLSRVHYMTMVLADPFGISSRDALDLARYLYERGDVPEAIAIAREIFAAAAHDDKALDMLPQWVRKLQKNAARDEPELVTLLPAVGWLVAGGHRRDAVRVLTTAGALFPFQGSTIIQRALDAIRASDPVPAPAEPADALRDIATNITGWPLSSVVIGAAHRRGLGLVGTGRAYATLLEQSPPRVARPLDSREVRRLIASADDIYMAGAKESAVRLAMTGLAGAKPQAMVRGVLKDVAPVRARVDRAARLLNLRGYPTEAANTIVNGLRAASHAPDWEQTYGRVREMLDRADWQPKTFAVRGAEAPPEPPEPAAAGPPPGGCGNGEPPLHYLVARTNDPVPVNTPFTLQARIGSDAPPAGPGQNSAPVRGDVTGPLTIAIYAPDFEVVDGDQRTIVVPPAGNSDWAPFQLRARKEGRFPIEVLAWKQSAQVAGLTMFVGIGAAHGDGETRSAIDGRDPEHGEYTLEVVFHEKTQQYEFRLRSHDGFVSEPMTSDPLTGPREQRYRDLVGALNGQARNIGGMTEYAQCEWMESMGSTLFRELVPADLKQLLWKNRDAIRYLNIRAKSEGMPWELLYVSDPTEEVAEGQFIADAATVYRWPFGPPPGRTLTRSTPYFVVPQGSPAGAQKEVAAVQEALGTGSGPIVTTLDDLLKLFNTGNFSLLHFASHNVADPSATGGLYVPFGNSKFDISFAGKWKSKQFQDRLPLVFMNACTSGGSVPLYTSLASWADRFVDSGSGAFIGSLWEIRDASALTFATTFYEAFAGGKNLGESMRAAKRSLKDSDPTRLAYTLYGNPLALLS